MKDQSSSVHDEKEKIALPHHKIVQNGYFSFMYDSKDVRFLLDFDHEHYKVIKKVTNENNVIRCILLFADILVIILKLYVCGLQP